MLIFGFILCFAVNLYGMESSGSTYKREANTKISYIYQYFDVKNDVQYGLRYNEEDYVLASANIKQHSSDVELLIEKKMDNPFISNKNIIRYIFLPANADVALSVLIFDTWEKIWDFFSNKTFNDLCEYEKTYTLIECTDSFNSCFYSCLILKRFLQDPYTFNLKQYLCNKDESTLLDQAYTQKRDTLLEQTRQELGVIDQKTLTLFEELKQKHQLVETLDKPIENISQDELSHVNNLIKLNQLTQQLNQDRLVRQKTSEFLQNIHIDELGEILTSKILHKECLKFFLKILYNSHEDTLDFSYCPLLDVMRKKTVKVFDTATQENILEVVEKSHFSYIIRTLDINLNNITKIKLFCSFPLEKNIGDILSSIQQIRLSVSNLKEIYFTDNTISDFFSKEYYDTFLRVLFYPEVDNDPIFYQAKKPVKIYIDKKIYENIFNEHKKYIDNVNNNLKIMSCKKAFQNMYNASYITAFFIMLWHLLWCKKNINFCLKAFLFGIHFYLNRYNKFALLSYRIMEFSPIVLLLARYGEWSNFPNIFKMPYSIPFLLGSVPLSVIFFCTEDWFKWYRNFSVKLDETEQRAIVNHGQFIFSYDPKAIT